MGLLDDRHHHTDYGTAWIRDQRPMSDAGLLRALANSDLRPRDWYRLLNRRVYFWTTEQRLNTMLSAEAYREKYHTVISLDTRRLLDRHLDQVELSAINSGAQSHSRIHAAQRPSSGLRGFRIRP